MKAEATRGRPGSWAATDSPEQKAEALPADLSEESEISPSYDADLGLNSLLQTTLSDEAWS